MVTQLFPMSFIFSYDILFLNQTSTRKRMVCVFASYSAIRNSCKLGSSRQTKFILQFWRSKAEMGPTGTNERSIDTFPLEALRGKFVSLPFQLLKATCTCWILPPSSKYTTSTSTLSSPLLLRLWSSCLPLIRALWWHQSCPDNTGQLPYLKIRDLITSAKVFLHKHKSQGLGPL